MPQLEPFRGIRYHPVLFPDLGEVVAPPYDVIGSRERQALLERHERNTVRLILGIEDPADPATPARYAHAARTLAEWIAEGTLIRDPRASLYGYAQRFRDPLDECGRILERSGFIGRIRLEPWGHGIHPHERTLAGPKADRLKLLRATRARLDPLFGIYSDPAGQLTHIVGSSRRAAAANSWTDDSGIEHALWPITDPASIELLVVGMAARDIVIADGHHRYETALAFREECERAGAPSGDADYVLMFLTPMEDPALLILPVHRLLSGVDEQDLRRRLDARFQVEPIAGGAGAIAGELGRDGAMLGFVGRGEAARLVAPDSIAGEHPAAIVDREILGGLLGWKAEEAVRAGRLRFTTDWREAAEAVARGEVSCALLLPPTPVTAVAAAALSGVTLPQKSTYFYPKIPSGLVFDLIEG